MLENVFVRHLLKCFLLILASLRALNGEAADPQFQTAFKEPSTGTIGLIEIGDKSTPISDATWIYVRAALAHFAKEKPDLLVVELNTPGGEVFAAERISDALKDFEAEYHIPVLAYVNNWAVSAGAMIAYSCRFIAASKGSIMGAAMPITESPEGIKEAPEKINSALRADFASRAQFFGRNPAIAQGMVDPDVVLVRRDGQIMKLSSMDEVRKGGDRPDEVISPKGKLLTLTAQELYDYGVADFLISPFSKKSSSVDLSKHPLSELPWPESMQKDTIKTYQMDWQTQFVVFLANPAVSSILVMVLMIAVYLEISSGGFGLAALAALTSLFFLGIVSFSQEAISWLEVLLLLFGILLIVIEIVFVPTFGFLAILGAVFCIAGAAGLILPGLSQVRIEGDSLNAAGEYVLTKLIWFLAATLVSLVIMVLLARPMKRRLASLSGIVLDRESQPGLELQKGEIKVALHALGKVTATLRPAGKVEIEGHLMDAVSTGEFIEAGATVRVVEVLPGKIVVEGI